MKRLIYVAVLLALLVPMTAFAHHNTISQFASCDSYGVSAQYVGGSGYRKVTWNVDLTVDGIKEDIDGSWQGTLSGFEIFNRSGSGAHSVQATGTVKMYDWRWGIFGYYWRLIETDTFNLNYTPDCYQECSEAVPTDWSPFEGDGIDKVSFRHWIDSQTEAICYTEYREKCVSNEFVPVWFHPNCSWGFRDRSWTEGIYAPAVGAQLKYCGCDFDTSVPGWGIELIGNCDDGFRYWSDLPLYNGCRDCE